MSIFSSQYKQQRGSQAKIKWHKVPACPMSDSVTERLDRIEATTERTANNLEVLTHQIGVLTEGITDMKASMSEGFADIRASLQELNRNAERQERNIDRLVGIVETLVGQQASK